MTDASQVITRRSIIRSRNCQKTCAVWKPVDVPKYVSISQFRWLRDVTSLTAFKRSNMKTEIVTESKILPIP